MFVDKTRVRVWHEDHLRLAVEAACVALWSWHIADDRFAMDERGFQLWGIPWSDQVTFEELSAHIHLPIGTGSGPPSPQPARLPARMKSISASSLMTTFDGFPHAARVPTSALSTAQCSVCSSM